MSYCDQRGVTLIPVHRRGNALRLVTETHAMLSSSHTTSLPSSTYALQLTRLSTKDHLPCAAPTLMQHTFPNSRVSSMLSCISRKLARPHPACQRRGRSMIKREERYLCRHLLFGLYSLFRVCFAEIISFTLLAPRQLLFPKRFIR